MGMLLKNVPHLALINVIIGHNLKTVDWPVPIQCR